MKNQTLIWVVNMSAPSKNSLKRLQATNGLSIAYAQTLLFHDQGRIEGKEPARLRVLEINNTNTYPETFVVNNSLARKYATYQISPEKYSRKVSETIRNQTDEEIETALEIDRAAGNGTLYNDTIDIHGDGEGKY
jgi:hypothetical protein